MRLVTSVAAIFTVTGCGPGIIVVSIRLISIPFEAFVIVNVIGFPISISPDIAENPGSVFSVLSSYVVVLPSIRDITSSVRKGNSTITTPRVWVAFVSLLSTLVVV